MEFVAIDVETANPDLASICQVGVVVFGPSGPLRTWKSLIDPEDEFNDVNVSIHGIDAVAVRGAPKFGDVFEPLRALLGGRIVVSHTAFDRVSITRAAARYSLPSIDCRWLDTARVARRAWEQFAKSGYGLADVAEWCEISFTHHRAEEDARAAGEILLRAIADTGMSLEDWLVRSTQPISDPSPITRAGDPTGPLAEEVVVFTGALTIPRREAADRAAACGCDVAMSVTKRTTLLVVGDQDVRKLAGQEKSSKHRKAEALIAGGQPIRILCESDFVRMAEGR